MADLFFAFLALLIFGSKDILNKKILETNDVFSILLIEYSLTILLLIASAFVFSTLAIPSEALLLLVVFSSVIGAASIVWYFSAVQSSRVSLVFAVASSYPLFSTLFSILFLGEPLLPVYFIALPIILIALFLLGYKKNNRGKRTAGAKSLFEPAVWLALFTSIGWGAYFTVAKVVSSSVNAFNASVWMEGGVLVALAVYLLASRKKITVPASGRVRLMALFYVLLFCVGVIAMNFSLLRAGVSMSSMITAAAPGLTALLAFLLLKEKLSKTQYAGIALLVGSLIMLSA